jgi:hypothetical protein
MRFTSSTIVPMPQPVVATSLLVLFAISLQGAPEEVVCARCHPKEVASYARTGMAKSLFAMAHGPKLPDGEVNHAASGTKFKIRNTAAGLIQSSQWKSESTEQTVAFVIGSGNHAFGFLVQRGDHIFQSPLSYYTRRHLWDVAPGYEKNPHPDFSRPVTADCLLSASLIQACRLPISSPGCGRKMSTPLMSIRV